MSGTLKRTTSKNNG